MSDLRLAVRTLAKSPVVSGVAILSLALGIGANTAIFSLFDQALLRALPISQPDRLVNLTSNGPKSGSVSTNNAGGNESIFSYPMFRDLEQQQKVFTGIAAHLTFGANLAYQGQTSSAQGMLVSGSYFPVLGLKPALGRLLDPQDDRNPGAHRLAVLSHAYWTERFQQSPQVLNQPLLVNGVLMTIVGVAPSDFKGTTLGQRPDVYVPLSMREEVNPGWKGFTNRRSYWAYLFARLKPGITVEQAEAAINGPFQAIIRDVELPQQKGSDRFRQQFAAQKMKLEPGYRGQSNMQEQAKVPLIMLLSITGFVLLIACANIANLLLARSAARGKEIAIRLSLGATRGTLIRQLLLEALVLAAIAGVAGLFVSQWTARLLFSLLPPDAEDVISLAINWRSLGFAAAASLTTGLLFGLFPALHSTRQDLASVMKDQAGNVSATGSATLFRRALVVGQIGLSLLLLISAGMFLKSLVNVLKVDLGLRTDKMIVFGLSPDLNKYTPERTLAFYQRLEESVRAIPGVTGITASTVSLLANNNWGSNVSVDGFESGPDTDTHSMFNQIGPGYFRTLGIPLVAGREFTDSDAANAPKAAIVNESFVRKFSPSQNALGKRMQQGSGGKNDIEIVGIVKDAKYSDVKQAVPPMFYRPYKQDKQMGSSNFYVHTAVDPNQIMPLLRRAVAELDANLPIENLKTLEAQVNENIALDRMISTMAAAF
ncbi:MAG: ABC transporter permease, partial [Acidobacteria bacterium]|nr:ABC transporter permease [Acidobacteriota bacterium]